MINEFTQPDWVPCVPAGMRILVTGATGGLGRALVKMLLKGPMCKIGAHGSSRPLKLEDDRIIPLFQTFKEERSCCKLIDDYVEQSGASML